MLQEREKFATQVNAALLKDVKTLAKEEGRQIQILVEEALEDLLEKRRNGKARPHVKAAYQNSLSSFGSLYQKLADYDRLSDNS